MIKFSRNSLNLLIYEDWSKFVEGVPGKLLNTKGCTILCCLLLLNFLIVVTVAPPKFSTFKNFIVYSLLGTQKHLVVILSDDNQIKRPKTVTSSHILYVKCLHGCRKDRRTIEILSINHLAAIVILLHGIASIKDSLLMPSNFRSFYFFFIFVFVLFFYLLLFFVLSMFKFRPCLQLQLLTKMQRHLKYL